MKCAMQQILIFAILILKCAIQWTIFKKGQRQTLTNITLAWKNHKNV